MAIVCLVSKQKLETWDIGCAADVILIQGEFQIATL
jgi:hypothetical protein